MISREQVHEVLVRARNVQAECGHCKHAFEDDWGNVCIGGALQRATTSDALDWDFGGAQVRCDAARAMGFTSMVRAAGWNNRPETTLADVLARFDAAIAATAPEPADPLAGMDVRESEGVRAMKTPEEFWSHVRVGNPNECWPWDASIGGPGYGTLYWRGGYENAHTLAWRLGVGPIPDGLCVLHHCDHRPCCNYIKCLFLGTRADNVADMIAKGRGGNRGSTNGQAKLTEDDVLVIRNRIASGERHGSIAVDYAIDPSVISHIKRGHLWSHV